MRRTRGAAPRTALHSTTPSPAWARTVRAKGSAAGAKMPTGSSDDGSIDHVGRDPPCPVGRQGQVRAPLRAERVGGHGIEGHVRAGRRALQADVERRVERRRRRGQREPHGAVARLAHRRRGRRRRARCPLGRGELPVYAPHEPVGELRRDDPGEREHRERDHPVADDRQGAGAVADGGLPLHDRGDERDEGHDREGADPHPRQQPVDVIEAGRCLHLPRHRLPGVFA